MSKFKVHFCRIKTDNIILFFFIPTIGLSKYKDKYLNSIGIHLVWLYWDLELLLNLKGK